MNVKTVNIRLEEVYKSADKLFPNISKFCKKCNTCCKTYGWLLKQEAKEFSKKGYPVVEINKNLYCFDSFIRDKNKKRIFDQIPRCLFCKKGSCSMYKERPLDCRLYPVKVKFKKERAIIGLSLGCKYISSLSEQEKERLCSDIPDFFKRMPQDIINDYLNLMEEVHLISKPKRFWMEKIIEVGKGNNSWRALK